MAIAGVLDNYKDTNLVIVPQAQAYALLLFCLRNPKYCPSRALGGAGDPRLPLPGATIDIRTMVTRYRSASFPRHFRSSLLSHAWHGRSTAEVGAGVVRVRNVCRSVNSSLSV